MRKNLVPRLLLYIIIIFVSCQKEAHDNNPAGPEIPPEQPSTNISDRSVISSFQGRITAANDEPVANAFISVGNRTAITNEFGIFRIDDVQVKEQFAVVKVEKSGYYPGYRTVFANANVSNFVTVKLVSRSFRGVVKAGVQLEAGNTTLTFSSNNFITSDSVPYEGETKAYVDYLDPELREFRQEMPGDLRGVDINNRLTALQSFGMLAVELEGSSGQKIHLAPGNEVQFEMEIPPSLLAQAPESIPLWYYDEKLGAWKEEGSAMKNGGKYQGKVRHFSVWNCDYPFSFVYVSVKIEKRGKLIEPLPYTEVRFIDAEGRYGFGFTDSTGMVSLMVPKGTPVKYEVLDECGAILASGDAGTFQANADIGKIRVSPSQEMFYSVKGTVVDCDDKPVKNGYASIMIAGLQHHLSVENGVVDAWVSSCRSASPVTAYALDSAAMEFSPLYSIPIVNNTIDLGQLRTCREDETSQYISYTVGEKEYNLQFPPDTLYYLRTGKETTITAFNGNGEMLYLVLWDTLPYKSGLGTLELDADSMRHINSPYSNGQIEVMRYGKVGEFIDVKYNTWLHNYYDNNIRLSTGRIRIKRTY